MVENKYKHAPTIMLSRNGDEAGEIRNLQSYRCPMEGCTGWRICVKWPDESPWHCRSRPNRSVGYALRCKGKEGA